MSLQLKIINLSPYPLPQYATEGSSGMDLRANITEPIILKSLQRSLVPTGLYIELPRGYEAQVRPRSGLAIKQGITCLNSPGTVDSDYRGEIKIVLVNLSPEEQLIQPGERIAQMVIQKIERAELQQVEILEESIRSHGGFGSTGSEVVSCKKLIPLAAYVFSSLLINLTESLVIKRRSPSMLKRVALKEIQIALSLYILMLAFTSWLLPSVPL